MAKAMMSFKDLFLIGFFLSIGLSGIPTWQEVTIAFFFSLLLPLKMILFFLILTRLKLRARTSFITTLNLSNYSEFGLIVGAIGAAMGWMSTEWLVIVAIALSMTFLMAASLNTRAHTIYARLSERLKHFETATRLPGDEPIETGDASVAIIGLGGAVAGDLERPDAGVDADRPQAAAGEEDRLGAGAAADVEDCRSGVDEPGGDRRRQLLGRPGALPVLEVHPLRPGPGRGAGPGQTADTGLQNVDSVSREWPYSGGRAPSHMRAEPSTAGIQ